jgi:hypothetical protein
MNMRAGRIILIISIFLFVSIHSANGAVLPGHLSKVHIIGNGTHIKSFDFRIDDIEFDGIHLGSVTTLRRHEKGSFSMHGNSGQLIYIYNGIRVNVTSGRVALNFTGDAGEAVTLASWAGNIFEFDPESFTINASGTNKKDVVVIMDGEEYHIPPGKRTQIVEIEIVQETKSQHSKQYFHGATPVIIFGSAHLDVTKIDIGSLRIENLAMRKKNDAQNFSTIVHINYDKYPDLVVIFDDISQFLYKDISYATLKGNLSDGTIINGKDTISISN